MRISVVIGLTAIVISSCSVSENTNYYTDDLYYDYEVTHNFNSSAILNNENVAVPDEAVVYYDEQESRRINPTFADRIAAYTEQNESPDYYEGDEFNDGNWSRPRSPHITGTSAFVIGAGSYSNYPFGSPGVISPYNTYNPYYYPYYPGQVVNYGGGTAYIPPRQQTTTPLETKPYRPNVSSSRYEMDRNARLIQPIRPVTQSPKPGTGNQNSNSGSNVRPSKPGYNSNSSRSYRSGSNAAPPGFYSNPGYYNNSRSNSSSGGGSGTVRGVKRR